MRRVLLTGANGFIGSALSGKLKARGWVVRAALRSTDVRPDEVEVVIVGDINAKTDWSAALAGVDFVVHLAARVPVMRETGPDRSPSFGSVTWIVPNDWPRRRHKQTFGEWFFLARSKSSLAN